MRYLMTAIALTLLTLSLPATAEWHSGYEPIMGTNIQVELWHDDAEKAEKAIAAVMGEMHRIDALMSTYKPDSELSRVNDNAAKAPVAVGAELFRLIDRSLQMSSLTEGAFDVTYASVGYLYDFRKGQRPSAETREAALEAIDYRHVILNPKKMTIEYAHENVRVDLGGIAKGYAVERGIAILKRFGVEHAIVTAGGDSRILGDKRGRPWTVGIREPRKDRALLTRMPLVDEAISTSGDYERFFESEGTRYHHIIHPRTGDSARDAMSVTVIGPDATKTDGLSTSVFVLGAEEGLDLIENLDGFEAVIVDADGALHYSSGLTPPAGVDAQAGTRPD